MNVIKEEVVFTFFDLKRFALRHCSRVIKGASLLGFCSFLFFLIQPLHYKHESTLRTLGGQSPSSLKIQELLPQLTGGPSADSAIAILQSKFLIGQVVEELGLQAFCTPDSWGTILVNRIKNRILFEMGLNVSSQERFSFSHVVFSGQESLKLLLRYNANGDYELWDRKKNLIGFARVGSPIISSWGTLTLSHLPQRAKSGVFYPLKLFPPEKTLKFWRRKLRVSPSKLDKNLVQLEMVDTGRHLGVQFLNTWMSCYEAFTRKEQEEIYQLQIQSLQQQSQELSSSYQQALFHHAQYLEQNIHDSGGLGYLEEIEALSVPKNGYMSKLLDVDLELKRLYSEGVTASQKNQSMNPMAASRLTAMTAPLRLKETEEFSDLNASLASELLIDYNRQKSVLQSQVNELVFLKNQMEKPDFEITSIGGVFEDHVTRDLVAKTSAIALQLKDTGNRSSREQERLMEEIASQKSFLSQYLSQTIELKIQKIELLKDNISSLKLSLEKLLRSEQDLLKHQLEDLKGSMKWLPQKWYQESVLTLKKEQVSALLKGVEQLISSLHMGKNSAKGGVKFLDRATIPEEPHDLRLWAISLITLLVGGLSLYGVLFFKTLYQGFPVSAALLKAQGFPVFRQEKLSGPLIDCISESSQAIVSVGGKHSARLAQLLSRRGYQTLLVSCVSDQSYQLVEPLHSASPESRGEYDYLSLDGPDRIEYLCSTHFKEKLTKLKTHYDRILIQTDVHASGVSLLRLADVAVIAVQQEDRQVLYPYFEWAEKLPTHRLTFIYAEDEL